MLLACSTSRWSKADSLVAFAHEHMAKLMCKCERSTGANRIDKQRLRAVERIDVAGAVARFCPPGGLHRPADFKRQLEIAPLPGVVRHAPFAHQPPQVAVGADIVEAVIVNADVRQMRRHHRKRPLAAKLQETVRRPSHRTEAARSHIENPASTPSSPWRCSGLSP